MATSVPFFRFQLSLPFSRLSDALVESAPRQPLRGVGPQPWGVVVVVLVDVVPTVAVVVVVVMLMDATCTAKVQALACEVSTSSWTLPPPSSARAMHVVISDVMMPELSGDELVRAIRTHGELDEMLIVLLAAKADDALRVRLLREDAQDSLTENLLVDDDRLVRFRSATSSRPLGYEVVEATEPRDAGRLAAENGGATGTRRLTPRSRGLPTAPRGLGSCPPFGCCEAGRWARP